MLFKKKPATRTEAAAELARQQAAVLREKAAPIAAVAGERAVSAAGSAKDWAGPRLAHACEVGLEKAAPRVEQAAKALGPRVDTVHDKFVDDVLPRLVDAVNTAAAAASSKADEMAKASHSGLDQVASTAAANRPVAKKQRRVGKGLVVLGVFAALGGVAFALFRRLSGPTEDPWAAPVNPVNTPVATPTPADPVEEPVTETDPVAAETDPVVTETDPVVSSAPSAAAQSPEPIVEEIDGNDAPEGDRKDV